MHRIVMDSFLESNDWLFSKEKYVLVSTSNCISTTTVTKVGTYTSNPSTWKAEAGGFPVQGQLEVFPVSVYRKGLLPTPEGATVVYYWNIGPPSFKWLVKAL